MKSMEEYLEMDGGMIMNVILYNRFSSFEDREYASICGGYIDGAIQWATHNVHDIDTTSNQKYTGWTIYMEDRTRRMYIPNWVMAIQPKDWKHAKALLNKYMLVDTKFNSAPENTFNVYHY